MIVCNKCKTEIIGTSEKPGEVLDIMELEGHDICNECFEKLITVVREWFKNDN